jgi:hypothetical protein
MFGEQRESLPFLLLQQVVHGSGEPPGALHIEVIANRIDAIVSNAVIEMVRSAQRCRLFAFDVGDKCFRATNACVAV